MVVWLPVDKLCSVPGTNLHMYKLSGLYYDFQKAERVDIEGHILWNFKTKEFDKDNLKVIVKC